MTVNKLLSNFQFDLLVEQPFIIQPIGVRSFDIGKMLRTERTFAYRLSPLAIGRMNRRQWRQAERWAWVFRLVTDTYTSSGSNTWTCPAGVTAVQAEVWGAGGSPSTSGISTNGRGGGGGGAYSLKSGIAVTPSSGYTAYVGKGVVALAGEDSYFVNSSTCMAKGGGTTTSTSAGTGGAAASGVGDTKYNGGNGGTGQVTGGGGGGGSSAGTAAAGNTGGNGVASGAGGSGATAPTGGGNGGTGGTYLTDNAQNGVQPGGGGGGRGRASSGTYPSGTGGHGKVAITYTLSDGLFIAMIG